MTDQLAMFAGTLAPCSEAAPNEVETAMGSGNATLIEWDGDAGQAIARAVEAFRLRGWDWDGATLHRDGWTAWFRSQGNLAPPIVQWSKAEVAA